MNKLKIIFVLSILGLTLLIVPKASAQSFDFGSCSTIGYNKARTGNCVLMLQQFLASQEFNPGIADGKFGRKTFGALVAFQRANGLFADGLAGKKTFAKIVALSQNTTPETGLVCCKIWPSGLETIYSSYSWRQKNECGVPVDVGIGGGFEIVSDSFCASGASTAPSIKVVSPNGGETWKIGETRNVSWQVTGASPDSWIWLTTFGGPYSGECFGGKIDVSQSSYNWKISDAAWGCSDAGLPYPTNTSFQTKIKAALYTGTPPCSGLPVPNDPCLTGTKILQAVDESDASFTIKNF
ncbi:MAG TPA: peptidoglycan-binding domain-containing protein [Candidatus Paceibacterota bacterium]|nr:peptidoglycan-binding domain-containing protein [Candidatus Paceibacterota bacterium]